MAKLQEKIDLKTGEMETLKGEVKEAKRNNDPIAEKKKLKLTKVMVFFENIKQRILFFSAS